MSTSASANEDCNMNIPVAGKPSYVRRGTQTADVVIYGDSITFQIAKMLPAAYGIDAMWGRKTKPTVDRMRWDMRDRAKMPSVVVMAIGSNDRSDPSGIPYQVRVARNTLPPTTRLIWLNVYAEGDPSGTKAVNEALAYPGVGKIDWHTRNVRMAQANGGRSPLVDSSGVHVNCAGAKARVYAIVSTINA